MASSKTLIAGAVGLTVGLFVIAFVVGPAFSGYYEGENQTVNQGVGQEVQVTGEVYANLTSVSSGTPDTATVNITDRVTDNSVEKTVSSGNSSTFTLQDDINVTVNSVDTSTDSANITYEYPSDYGWSDSGSSLFNVLLFMGLVLFIALLAGVTMKEL